jgi:transcriptional regulator with GAF, ATPase, and Fis domain
MSETTPEKSKDTIRRLLEGVDRLDAAMEQTLQALRKRGIQPSVDLTGMMRSVRRDLEVITTTAGQDAERVRQLQELVRVSALVNSSLDLDLVLEDVMDTVIHLAGAERGYLVLIDKRTGDLDLRTARNWDRENMADGEAIFSRGIINAAIAQKEPILTTNAQQDARFQAMQSVVQHALRSIVCVPMIVRDEVVGVLYADNKIGQGVFNPENLPILGVFANQAAVAIQNARVHGKVKADLAKAEQEVMELRIIIDESKRQTQISEITNTEYFKSLETMAKNMRRARGASDDAASSGQEADAAPEA